jgi:hypothetical protein
MKTIRILIIAFSLSVSFIQAQQLLVEQVIQEQDQWCWAGSSCCVLKYYGNNIAQCTIAEYTRSTAIWHNFGTIDCCTDPEGDCNYWNYNWGYLGSIQDILQHWGVDNFGVDHAFNLSLIKSELTAKRPFIFRWGWTTGGGHFLVGHGISMTDSMMSYMNPWPGEGLKIAKYSWVVLASDHTWTHTNQISTIPTSVADYYPGILPKEYSLQQNYPNPFNPSTLIKYALPYNSNVHLVVYNSLGQLVKNIDYGFKELGIHEVNFIAASLPSGVYFYTLKANSADGTQNFTSSKKMMVLK